MTIWLPAWCPAALGNQRSWRCCRWWPSRGSAARSRSEVTRYSRVHDALTTDRGRQSRAASNASRPNKVGKRIMMQRGVKKKHVLYVNSSILHVSVLHCCTWSASAVVKQYAVLFRTPSTDWRACLTGDQASRLCCTVKRASSPTSTTRELRTELSCKASDHGTES